MEKVTAIVTCQNREDEIEACLKSVRWADELIVVDSGSTDRTVELARPYADRLLVHEYRSAAAQRNWAIPQASHPWVLIIDSDEVMPESLREEIRKELKNPRFGRYRVFRRGIFLGREMKHGGWANDQNNILFRKDTYRFSDDEVHPVLLPEDNPGILKNRLDHYTHRTVDEFIVKSHRYAVWSARKYLRRGRKGRAANILLHPLYNFCRNYVFRLGFLDGAQGVISAVLSSCYVAEKYARLWDLGRNNGQEPGAEEKGKER
jgi:glycosyltransferase involved in cell wall biosynthesis